MWGFLVVLFVHDLFSRFLLWIFEHAANFFCLPCSFLTAFCSNTSDVHYRSRLFGAKSGRCLLEGQLEAVSKAVPGRGWMQSAEE